jgi:hypothetical protein
MRIKISFAGSFQCRLATDPDDTDSSPNEPTKTPGDLNALGRGWTFAYHEPAPGADDDDDTEKKPSLDRVIRLSNPWWLRNLLVDPWEDTKVTLVEVSRSLAPGMSPAPDKLSDDLMLVPFQNDPLVGKVVSLGQAKFASLHPGGLAGADGREVLADFAFSIGGMTFTASQLGKTRGTGANALGKDVETYYMQKKTALLYQLLNPDGSPVKGASFIHPARARYLTEYFDFAPHRKEDGAFPRNIQSHASFFALDCNWPNIPLTQVQIRAITGILPLAQKENLAWKLSLNFSRFDADALAGKIKGVLEGSK